MKRPSDWTGDDLLGLGIILAFAGVVLGAIALAGTAIVMAIRSNGERDYCYVETLSPEGMAPQYRAFEHRPWRADRSVGIYPTRAEATASLGDCPTK